MAWSEERKEKQRQLWLDKWSDGQFAEQQVKKLHHGRDMRWLRYWGVFDMPIKITPANPNMNVLVVCHANINRSAFCAAIIQRLKPDWIVRGAGVKPGAAKGARAALKARKQATARGFSLEEHRSQRINEKLLAEADVVLFMDMGNKKRLIDMFGENAKFVSLGSYAGFDRVPDPNFTPYGPEQDRQFEIAEMSAKGFVEYHS